MNSYTPANPPKRGNAKRIWDGLHKAGCNVRELHYNPNCWTRPGISANGWGTWAFTDDSSRDGYWCGLVEGRIYMQQMYAPYSAVFVT